MPFDSFFQNCLTDTEAKAMELLHENIRRQAFFDKPWPRAKNPSKNGRKLLYQSGDMQDGYMSHIDGMNIHITNSVSYAGVHNEGAEIPVTAQMKKYFWAMYYKATSGTQKAKGIRRNALSAEAAYWKSLALMKIGTKIKIPERRVMGEHPQLDAAIEKEINRNMKETINEMMNNLKP